MPRSLGIWKFSKNVEPAKEFLKWFFEPQQYHVWVLSGDNYNHPMCRDMENHIPNMFAKVVTNTAKPKEAILWAENEIKRAFEK